jgi:hypothetical protein
MVIRFNQSLVLSIFCMLGINETWQATASACILYGAILYSVWVLIQNIYTYILSLSDSDDETRFTRFCALISLAVSVLFLKFRGEREAEINVVRYVFRPVIDIACLWAIEFFYSVWCREESGSKLLAEVKTIPTYIESKKGLLLQEVRKFIFQEQQIDVPFWKTDNIQEKRVQKAALLAICTLIFHFCVDPIVGRNSLLHHVLETFLLDFDIVIYFSGPLTALFVVVMCMKWLTNVDAFISPVCRVLRTKCFVAIHGLVLWWYWRLIMQQSEQFLVWLNLGYPTLINLRSTFIICINANIALSYISKDFADMFKLVSPNPHKPFRCTAASRPPASSSASPYTQAHDALLKFIDKIIGMVRVGNKNTNEKESQESTQEIPGIMGKLPSWIAYALYAFLAVQFFESIGFELTSIKVRPPHTLFSNQFSVQ